MATSLVGTALVVAGLAEFLCQYYYSGQTFGPSDKHKDHG
jgi:hypothetical protein